ncbi:hypothetical protein VJJ74_06800 [Parvimonas micra]|jgi:hypothetical protein|uniref:Uncharacterized protein n=1 Tax=Parvimonas micra TaxID=33033 RepID=A0A0B4S2D3_9FIRM|nr:hypothetical protein [Parvimonas micra]AIZ36776.1 hypothetical protein NW74_05225 [Parvimonas micra]MBF1306765.1 hypothetical protein [Parvimonas micra]MCK6130551.1 hypothetical protein [Parvimonas micra]MCK6136198.1 hypothetical protein [Parvimonas micra]MCK6137669.1 hypothetical protein [Parvimonas micra]
MENFGISVKFQYDIDDFLEKIDEFAENGNYGFSLEEMDGLMILNFEILPYLSLNFKIDEEIEMKTETCYYGVGYHILVVDFINELFSFLGCKFEIKDDTGFYKDGNFERLKEMYDLWFKNRVELILNNRDNIRIKSIFMDNKKIFPVTIEDYICTYMGVISLTEFENLYTNDIEAIKKRIFLFNEKVLDPYSDENYLLYHVWNNLKDLTLVDDFDERLSMVMFMFENLIENNVQIHLPQKYSREIYKYLGVNKFSASNFAYRKVRYEVGYHFYDKFLKDLDFSLKIPSWFEYNGKIKGYLTTDNAIFLNEYASSDGFNFDEKYLSEKSSDNFKILIFDTINKNKFFLGFENLDDEYGYVSIQEQNNMNCEETNCQIVDLKRNKMYEICVLGTESTEIIKHMIELM